MEISEIAIICQNHPTDDALEEYCFSRLSEEDAAPIEEHLLICAQCQSALAQLDDYIHLFRAAAVAPEPRRIWAFRPWTWGPALALSCAAVFWALLPSIPSQAVPVTLASYRGADPALIAHAPRSRPLDLSMNAVDVPSAASYRIEVVTSAGSGVWKERVSAGNGKITAHLARGLSAGTYWVRVYGTESDLLSEIGLRVE